MRIGFVVYGSLDSISGGYLYDRKLVEYLRQQGITVEIISLPWRNYASHLMDNFRFRLPGYGFVPGSSMTDQPFDILIQDELCHPSLIRANAGRYACPIVSLVHHLRCSESRPDWQNGFYRLIEKKYLQGVDGFIFNSKTTQKVVQGLIGSNKPNVVAHPPTDRFGSPLPESEIVDRAKNGTLRILFIGNIIYRKGLHTLLKAIGELNVRMDVVGGPEFEPKYAYEMQRYVLIHGLSSKITFHGMLDNQPLEELYKRSHLLAVPSSYEGYGIVYLEGMGFGLPAIGTTSGAAGEIITHAENGYLIRSDDSITLANHLNNLAANRELLAELSRNALKRYQSQPNWVDSAGKIHKFLQNQIREFSVQ